MNRRVVLFVLLLLLAMPAAVHAGERNIQVLVNGKEVVFPDQQPYIDENDRTLVPVRFVSESLGAEVDWDDAEKKVTVLNGKRQVILRIGESQAQVDGIPKTFDTKAVIKNSRTMVPLRFISEMLGAEVTWVGETSTVKIVMDTHGYTLPPKGSSELGIDIPVRGDNPSQTDITLAVALWLPLEPQYADVQSILASKFGTEAAGEIVEYVKVKTSEWDELPDKSWILNKQMILVGSLAGQMSIIIQIWQAGVGL